MTALIPIFAFVALMVLGVQISFFINLIPSNVKDRFLIATGTTIVIDAISIFFDRIFLSQLRSFLPNDPRYYISVMVIFGFLVAMFGIYLMRKYTKILFTTGMLVYSVLIGLAFGGANIFLIYLYWMWSTGKM